MVYTRDRLAGLAGAAAGGYGGVVGTQSALAAMQRQRLLNRAYSLEKDGRRKYKEQKKQYKTDYQTFGDTNAKNRYGNYVTKKGSKKWGYTPSLLGVGKLDDLKAKDYDLGQVLKYGDNGKVKRGSYNSDNWIDRNKAAVAEVLGEDNKTVITPAVDSGKARYKAAQKTLRKERAFLDKALRKQGMNAMGGVRGDYTKALEFKWKKGLNKTNRKALLAGGRLGGGGLVGAGLGYGLGSGGSALLRRLGY